MIKRYFMWKCLLCDERFEDRASAAEHEKDVEAQAEVNKAKEVHVRSFYGKKLPVYQVPRYPGDNYRLVLTGVVHRHVVGVVEREHRLWAVLDDVVPRVVDAGEGYNYDLAFTKEVGPNCLRLDGFVDGRVEVPASGPMIRLRDCSKDTCFLERRIREWETKGLQ